MPEEVLVVVGDRFPQFAANRGTVTASQLLERLRSGEAGTPLRLALGQGLSPEQRAEIGKFAANGAVVCHDGVPVPAEHRTVRPGHPPTALVGQVAQTAPDRFTAPLLLDERVDLLQDRLSGQHVSAITLLEAARQMWVTVTEQFLLSAEERATCVISEVTGVSAAYHRYVFPLPATVEFHLTSHGTALAERFGFTVAFHQNGRLTTEIAAEIGVLPQPVAKKQEALAARQALHDTLAPLRAAQPAPATAPHPGGIPV
ncbi:AfsA-related hotdog domain-containing protein [Streptomyces sp. NPDC002067]